MRYVILISFLLLTIKVSSQQETKQYNFSIYDGPKLFTMQQFNTNYLSSYRLLSRSLNQVSQNIYVKTGAKFIFLAFIGMPLTHEEGHRSILTDQSIGSISQPFFNSKGVAYVKGVTDASLKDLRDNHLTDFIHLHTAGLESDYILAKQEEQMLIFHQENFDVLYEEFILRKISPVNYHLTTLIPGMFPEIKEENNELDRDIVGHDIWGMVRHLFRPDMPFKRYTNFDDLTADEKRYAKKLAYRSFINFASPTLFHIKNFKIAGDVQFNFSLGHSLAPFGDYFEQNFWLIKSELFFHFYIRQYMNLNNTYWAGGVSLIKFPLFNNKLHVTTNFDFWQQPKDFSFVENKDFQGFSFQTGLDIDIFKSKKTIKTMGINLQYQYKSKGFLEGIASLDKNNNFRVGCYVRY